MSRRYILRSVTGTEREQWDHFVCKHPSGHLLQSWEWGELKASAGWHPLRLALWDAEQNEIRAIAQILRKGFGSFPVLAGHLAHIPKGPVMDWSQPLPGITNFNEIAHPSVGASAQRSGARFNPSCPPPIDRPAANPTTYPAYTLKTHNTEQQASLAPTFLTLINTKLRRDGALALQMELGEEVGTPGSDAIVSYLETLQFHPTQAIQPARTILLDITPNEETLLARMKEKWRYNVRLAGRKGVQVRIAQTAEDVRAWYALLQTTGERNQFGIHTLDYYLRAWQIFMPRNMARLFLADYQGQLLAGIFVGLFAKQAIYLYGASSNEHRYLMPNYLLQWEAIRWAKREGATTYDLWGISETDDESDALAGVSRFKSGWGGEIVRFVGNYEHIYRPLRMRLARKLLPYLKGG